MNDALPDVIAPGLSVLFCGINPGATSAAAGHSFSNSSNRFWRILYGAGFTPRLLTAPEEQRLLDYGIGLTAAAPRPTRRADELSRAELIRAVEPLREKVERYAPNTIAFLGKPIYAAIHGRAVDWGPQPAPFGGARAWVLPNPSGLNRNFSLAQLIVAYSALREAVTTTPSPLLGGDVPRRAV